MSYEVLVRQTVEQIKEDKLAYGTMYMLAESCKDPDVLYAIALKRECWDQLLGNPCTPCEALMYMYEHTPGMTSAEVEDYVLHPNVSQEFLLELSGSGWEQVRADAARRLEDPVRLMALADDEFFEVRQSVALNYHATAATLERLANDERAEVRLNVTFNPSAPKTVLAALAKDENRDVMHFAQDRLKTIKACEERRAKLRKAKK